MDINLLFKPYTKDGCTPELCIKWLCKTHPDIPLMVHQQAFMDVMHRVSMGEDFTGPCECGCDMTNAHTKINHMMAARTKEIHGDAEKAFLKSLQDKENKRIEDELRKISTFDKDFIKMNKPPLSERSPVLRGVKKMFKK